MTFPSTSCVHLYQGSLETNIIGLKKQTGCLTSAIFLHWSSLFNHANITVDSVLELQKGTRLNKGYSQFKLPKKKKKKSH